MHITTEFELLGELEPYDAGLLSAFGGGDVDWWHDYIRAELERAHDFYQAQLAATPQPDTAVIEHRHVLAAQLDEEPVGFVSQDFLDGKWTLDHIAKSDEGQISRTIPVFTRAQPSAEPVAWAQSEHSYDPERHGMQRRLSWKKLESDDAPLYAHPPTDSAALRDAGVSEQDLMALLLGPYYMDTPDGGSVTVLEQLQRMARDAARWRAACAMKDFPQYMGIFGWQMAEIAEMFDTPDQAIDAAIAQQEADHD